MKYDSIKNNLTAEEVVKGIKELSELHKHKDKLDKEIYFLLMSIQFSCKHTEIEETSSYHSGSYNNLASTTYTTKCKICGLTLNKRTVEHSWFG